MAISKSMNFEVATLIDITNTGQTKFRSEDRLAINQQANWNTFLQVIGLRANPYFDQKPSVVEDLDISDSEFGNSYKGKHKVWHFKFRIEQEGALSVGALTDDFNLVPVIAGLTESITTNNNAFRTNGESKNIIFKLVDKDE
tara:strand:- start:46503 stop:46928 length:426 start_codon:yes stop_codon:yes gene_type:complete